MSMPPPMSAPAGPPPTQQYQVVPGGMRAYRRAIRSSGPLWALLPPAVLGALSFLLLRDNDSAVRGIAGFGLAVLAAPGLLVAGVPLRSGAGVYLAAAVGSAVLWFVVGVVAAHRATANPTATWRHFWREYALLMLAAWIGVGVALMMANLLLGRLLF